MRRLLALPRPVVAVSVATTVVLATSSPAGADTAVSFTEPFAFATSQPVPWEIKTGDLNRDGRDDIVTANAGQLGSGGVSVLFNQTGTGAAVPRFTNPTNLIAGPGTTGVTLADFNGDGTQDIASANTFTPGVFGVSVLMNRTAAGSTTAAFGAPLQLTAGLAASQIETGDVNGDGRADIVVGNFASPFVAAMTVLINTTSDGAASASFSRPYSFTAGWGAEGLGIGDLNADGKPDVVLGNTISSQVSVRINTTTRGADRPTFAGVRHFATPLTTGIQLGDFNGDGTLDIASASTVGNPKAGIYVFSNHTAPGSTTPVLDNLRWFGTGYLTEDIAAADYNADGKVDLAVSNDVSSPGIMPGVSVLINTTPAGAADTEFAPTQDFDAGTGTNSVADADFNTDGRPDLVTGNVASFGPGAISVILNITH